MATAAKRKSKAMMRAEIVNWLGMGAAANPRFKTGRAICDELVAEGLAYKEDDGYWATADLRRAKAATKMGDSYQAKDSDMTPRRKPTENMGDPRGQFGEFLRDRIEKHFGGDEEKIAKALGLSTGRTLRKWMEGVHGPAFQDLDKIAKALGLDDWYAMTAAVKKFRDRPKK
jgi:transcriptional regulator with XRE-family HTH domain